MSVNEIYPLGTKPPQGWEATPVFERIGGDPQTDEEIGVELVPTDEHFGLSDALYESYAKQQRFVDHFFGVAMVDGVEVSA